MKKMLIFAAIAFVCIILIGVLGEHSDVTSVSSNPEKEPTAIVTGETTSKEEITVNDTNVLKDDASDSILETEQEASKPSSEDYPLVMHDGLDKLQSYFVEICENISTIENTALANNLTYIQTDNGEHTVKEVTEDPSDNDADPLFSENYVRLSWASDMYVNTRSYRYYFYGIGVYVEKYTGASGSSEIRIERFGDERVSIEKQSFNDIEDAMLYFSEIARNNNEE